MNVREKSIDIFHTVKESSLKITEKAILFNSIEWAIDILASIEQLEMFILSITFADEQIVSHASDDLVVGLLRLILTRCVNSIRVLTLTHLDQSYFDKMQEFHPNNGPFLPYLESITLTNIGITYRLLQMFSHTKMLRLNDPSRMEFSAKEIKNIKIISFNNLECLILSFNKSNTLFGEQLLPIELTIVKSIQILDRYRLPFYSNDISISMHSLASTTTLSELKIVGGGRTYSLRELNSFKSKKMFEILTVPLHASANIKDVFKFICNAEHLILFTFILDQLSANDRRKFKRYKKIKCPKLRNAMAKKYEAKYTEISNSFIEYTVRRVSSN